MPALRGPVRGLIALLISLAMALALGACDGADEPEATPTSGGDEIDLVMSDVSRNVVEPAAVASVSEATNAFAADVYAALVEGSSENLVFSPYSAAVALAMTREGARGETADEMDAVLHADLAGGGGALGAGFNGLDQSLAAIPGEYPLGDGEKVELELTTANQLFGQQGFGFEQEFLDTLAADYGAGMRLVDYQSDPEAARELINGWVDAQTHERIPELIPEGVIKEITRLVLTSAVYLNAPWQHRFEEDATEDGDFRTLTGETVEAAFMHQAATFRYASEQGYQVVELPYVGGKLSMLVIVPDDGSFEAVEAGLDAGRIAEFSGGLASARVDLALPRFEFRTQSPLKQVLSDLGMPTAFAARADFSGITSEASLLIADVLHEAFISVDEEGTEAAAATAVVMDLTSAPTEQVELTVDRPFLFLIKDRETGAALFMGRVTDPTTG